MKLLAIETSETACSAAVWVDGSVAEVFDLVPRRHSELLLPMIEQVLADASVSKRELDAIGFGRGPGSFTGVRIATGVAQGLGYALDCPLVPVSTLAGIAQGVSARSGSERIAVALDARMQEVYWGCYQIDSESGVAILSGEERCCAPGDVQLDGEGWTACGSGWESYSEILLDKLGDSIVTIDAEPHCHAQDIAIIAADAFRRGEGVEASSATPLYLRNQVASLPS